MVLLNSLCDYFEDIDGLAPAIEAVIFASDEPISMEEICEIFSVTPKKRNRKRDKGYSSAKCKTGSIELNVHKQKKEMVSKAMEFIKSRFNEDIGHGIYLSVNNGNYSFKTKPEYYGVISEFLKVKPQKFTKPQLETLSIIAYKQPVIKSEVDLIRGVDSGGVVRFLLEKNLIRVAGRKDIIGRPLIYKTTNHFMDVFNLKDLGDLPSVKEIEEVIKKEKKALDEGEQKELLFDE